MRYAILSDIHANYDALETVLGILEKENIDNYVCLGDVVGYGAEPSRCLQTVREKCVACIAGNHDFAAVEKTNIEFFNQFAKEATLWTRKQLSEEERKWLEELPLVQDVDDQFTIVHGTLYSPPLFDYIQTSFDAYLSLQVLQKQVCFLGHSHVPITFLMSDSIKYTLDPEIKLEEGVKYLVNVGSVGQPRDDNPKAAFAIYDTDKSVVEIRRVEYDIESTISKIGNAGLPEVLGERLRFGR